jgi:glucosamine--fructose-6-phosphate aminotransferase (isomerizing)
MCGIVGYCGYKAASDILLEGLKRLEYRGYDSAGISTLEDGKLSILKCKGKIKDLRSIVPKTQKGKIGIGHTRWATHGEVNDANAHPHKSGKVSIVHNGIIENYSALKEKLISEGVEFESETDSEIIAHLINKFYSGSLEEAVKKTIEKLKGTYGIAAMHEDEPELLVGARNGSPLVLGIGEKEMFLASDVTAMMAYTKQVVYLEDGELVTITPNSFHTYDLANENIQKDVHNVDWDLEEIEKAGYETFMEKEIHEQPRSVFRGMRGRLEIANSTSHLGGLNMSSQELSNVERVKIIAAGTSFHAGLIGAYLLETVARIPATAELASEVRYRNPIVEKNCLYFAISQSGETADTLYAMRELQRKGARVLGICNVVGSTIARESDGGVYIHSGPEIAVASTKAFTSQLTALYLFTLLMARMRHMSVSAGNNMLRNLQSLPADLEKTLARSLEVEKVAKKYMDAKDFLFLGRGINYPGALEGALKLKEISYIHAEGYSAAEIKHGPIALINEETPSLFLIPDDDLREKVITNMKEIKARKGPVIAVAVEGDEEVASIADDVIWVPKVHELMYPFIMAIPLQLFSYYIAKHLDRNVDQPRNLAKSVTVE